jgi:PAS domain S-box-containing protein
VRRAFKGEKSDTVLKVHVVTRQLKEPLTQRAVHLGASLQTWLSKVFDLHAKAKRPILIAQVVFVAAGIVLVIIGTLIAQTTKYEDFLTVAFILPGIFLLGIVIVLGVYSDAERKKLENALLESEEKLRRVFEATADGIVVAGLDTKIIDCNQATLSLFGCTSKKEIVGKSGLDLVAQRSREATLAHIENSLSTNQRVSKNVECTLVTKEGQEFQAEVSSSITKDSAGRSKYVVIIGRDITQHKKTEKQLHEYMEHLEEKVDERTQKLKDAQAQVVKSERLAAIGQLAAMVGHDLRNPLASIAGAQYYLKRKLALQIDEKTKEMLEVIERSVYHSEKIIADLLDYSRELHLELEETSPKAVVKEALDLVQIPTTITISDQTHAEHSIVVDIEKAKRVFANIIKNAVDAMSDGGKMTITSRMLEDNCEIALKDTGKGMTPEILDKIWSPLFTTKTKGVGLGLAICKRIIEAHGGSIRVESIVGEGTTFTVVVPLKHRTLNEDLIVASPEMRQFLATSGKQKDQIAIRKKDGHHTMDRCVSQYKVFKEQG